MEHVPLVALAVGDRGYKDVWVVSSFLWVPGTHELWDA